MRSKKVKQICFIGLVASIYASTTVFLTPISFGNIQCRVAESITLLAILCPEAIFGVTIGCAISNTICVAMGASMIGIIDIVVGTFATLLAGSITYACRNIRINNIPWISVLAPIVCNGVFIGAELAIVLAPHAFLTMFLICGLEVALGEAIACVFLGLPLVLRLEKIKLFRN